MRLYGLLRQDFAALTEVRTFRADPAQAARARDAAALEQRLTRLNGELGSLFNLVEDADVGPTSQALDALAASERALEQALADWAALKTRT